MQGIPKGIFLQLLKSKNRIKSDKKQKKPTHRGNGYVSLYLQ